MIETAKKPWQHGYDLDYLKQLEQFFAPHNRYAMSPFGQFKKNDIATCLHQRSLRIIGNDHKSPIAAYVYERTKMAGTIKMFSDVVIGEKYRGDVTFSCLAGNTAILHDALEHYQHENCWLMTYAGNREIRGLAEQAHFRYVGHKITSFSEILSIYFRDSCVNFFPRTFTPINPVELVGMAHIHTVDHMLLASIQQQLEQLSPSFTNHYSNYNTKNAWSALSLRGYSPDPTFITKPIEMNKQWIKEHKHEHFYLQDTPLYTQFPHIRQLLSFLDGEVHRIRFMKLAPGGGELQRHTDQVDPDAGNSLGALARLHFPLKTNKDVVFSTWNKDDEQENYHYAVGECWVIDTRKPHMAINKGTEERIHLVVDTVVTPKLERMICEGISRQIA